MKNAAPKAQDADAKPYQPTPFEIKAGKAFVEGRAKRGPRLKAISGAVEIDHPDRLFGELALMKAVGTTDGDFLDGLIKQLANAGSHGDEADERGINFMLAVVKGIEPRDQIEAMLASQMAAVHNATMTFARRLAHVENIPQQDSAQNAFNKLARTFAAQVEALKRYRSGGEPSRGAQELRGTQSRGGRPGQAAAPLSGQQPQALAAGHRRRAGDGRACHGRREAICRGRHRPHDRGETAITR